MSRLLTEEQKIAVEVLDQPMVLSAGAGSGKTTVLVERYVALVRSGLDPASILCLTFTNEAAGELRERIVKRLAQLEIGQETIDSIENSPWIGTIHSFCYTVLDTYGSLIQLPPIEEISGFFELSHLFQIHYRTWFESLEDRSLSGLLQFFSARELKEMVEKLFFEHFHFSQAVKRIEKSDFPEHKMIRRLHQLTEPLFQKITGEIHSKGAFTFSDLETLALKLFTQNAFARTKAQKQFRSLLIDEFQDTSQLQWSILQFLLDKEWKKLFVVGDPKQSIYGFRHADVSLFRNVSQQVQEKGGLVRELTLNFRTQADLLAGINRVSQTLFENASVPFSPMHHGRESAGPAITFLDYSLPEDADRKTAQQEEVKTIVHCVQNHLRGGASPSQIALLFRNGDRLKNYQDALWEAGIPSLSQASRSLFESDEIADIANYLRAVEDPYDDFALGSFLRSAFVGLPPETLSLYRKNRDLPLITALIQQPLHSLDWFFALLERGETRVLFLLEELFTRTKHFPEFKEGFLALLEPLSKIETLPEAIEKLKTWENKGIQVEVGDGGSKEAVRLMTVHSAKGLEFDHVLLADCLRQMPYGVPSLLIPPDSPPGIRYKKGGDTIQSKDYEQNLEKLRHLDMEEAKRILYVALTRARETLTLVLPQNLKTLPKGSWSFLLKEAIKEGASL